MQNISKKDAKFKYIRFFIMILLYFCSSLFQIIPIIIFNININDLENNVLIQGLLALFSTIISLMVIFLLYKDELIKDFKNIVEMKKEKRMIIFDHAFRYWLIGLLIMIVSNFFIGKLGIGIASNDAGVRSNLESYPLVYGFSTLIFIPLFEESVFRLAFKDIFKNKWFFILMSGFIFGSIHVIFSINTLGELLYLIPYCSLGLAFSYTYYESNNIFVSYFFHILHNSLTALSVFILAGNVLW